MEQEVETVTNDRLIAFLENWYGTPYKYGGDKKTGIDCSAFTCAMMDTVYNVTLPRTSREQYAAGKRISKSDLEVKTYQCFLIPQEEFHTLAFT